ncbi:16S rRNA-processing protein RimM [Gloeomargarita lithophora Alchichica-D10]|uniref:Ribosome maturation factor RimM n=1 Tax=Gloeomargarita lithophora Alchichica-D10 TaxID=1188229 RepID=A0A1J0AF32_9CYAN|nr:ribosome maturation factor RimM [Gloeomargarita lithophora]APB34527.1 16S rRNA-processing protein RimM [Gloeomargarita lithophora Alchichica-D10]
MREIGRILAPHGLRGEVKVLCLSDFPERFTQSGRRWYSLPDQPDHQALTLVRSRPVPGKNLYVVQFQECTTCDQAELLRGATLWVEDSQRPHLAEDEFYVPDLIGLTAWVGGEPLGQITAVIPAGNDLLEITTPTGQVHWVPFVAELVPLVAINERRLELTLPPGLLELNQTQSKTPGFA